MEDENNAKLCKKMLSCITSKERHPTPLHGYIPKKNKVTGDRNQSENGHEKVKSSFINDVKSASTLEKSRSKVISMCIIPVSIKYENNGK